jgi:hypothetical protein
MQYHTTTLTAPDAKTINPSDGVLQVSISPNTSSSASIVGNLPFQGTASSVIPISEGESLTLSAMSLPSPIGNITITAVSGTVDVILGF